MLTITYHFHVLPRHWSHLEHAYQATRSTLQRTWGLVSHQFKSPHNREDAFTLQLIWASRSGFEHFTRAWFGVWILNGLGLPHEAFASPIATEMNSRSTLPHAAKRTSRGHQPIHH